MKCVYEIIIICLTAKITDISAIAGWQHCSRSRPKMFRLLIKETHSMKYPVPESRGDGDGYLLPKASNTEADIYYLSPPASSTEADI